MGIGDTVMKDTTVSLKQAASACDAAFINNAAIMSIKTQSIKVNPCFGASMKDLLKAGFDNGDTIALAEIARRAALNDKTTEDFLHTKFKGIQREDDKAKAKAEVVAPIVAIPSQADAVAQLFAMLQQAGLVTTVNLPAKTTVVAAPVAPVTHPDVARNCKVIVADAIRLKDRESLKAGLVELGLVKADCRQRFGALAKVAEQLQVGIKKHATPKSVPNLSVQFGNTKFVN